MSLARNTLISVSHCTLRSAANLPCVPAESRPRHNVSQRLEVCAVNRVPGCTRYTNIQRHPSCPRRPHARSGPMWKTKNLRGRPPGRPAEGLRRQMFGHVPVGPCLTPPLVSPIFVPFSVYYLKTSFSVYYLKTYKEGVAARVLAIVHAWSAWRAALQRCVPHRRQRSSSLACSLLRLLQSVCSLNTNCRACVH